MPVLTPALREQIRGILGALRSPVTLRVFTRKDPGCENCEDAEQIATTLVELSGDRLIAAIVDVDRDPVSARELGIERVPAIVVRPERHSTRGAGVRFFGAPSGYEFGTLVETIRIAGSGAADLLPATIAALSRVDTPLHIQVFVTPTCPYCPRAALLANKLALASPFVTSDIVDASEFPELAERYEVYGVPRTVINETTAIEGAVPESALLAQLLPILEASA